MTDILAEADYLINQCRILLSHEDYKCFITLLKLGSNGQVQSMRIESLILDMLRANSITLSEYASVYFMYYRYLKLELDMTLM